MVIVENVRALRTEMPERKTMPRSVFVNSGPLRYAQNISVGSHVLQADEPSDYGGNDVGPNPYELLLAALGACTNMTVRMYAERKQWPLQGVQVSLSYAKVHAEDCAECETKVGMVDRIEVGISFTGDLSEEQQRKLLEIANKCPVHRTLVSRCQIDTKLELNHV
jgi:putative redox protein